MIETLLVIICLLLLKIAYQLIDIASAARHFHEDHPVSARLENDFRQSVVGNLKEIRRESARNK